jgi:hypothetical protein
MQNVKLNPLHILGNKLLYCVMWQADLLAGRKGVEVRCSFGKMCPYILFFSVLLYVAACLENGVCRWEGEVPSVQLRLKCVRTSFKRAQCSSERRVCISLSKLCLSPYRFLLFCYRSLLCARERNQGLQPLELCCRWEVRSHVTCTRVL